MGLREKAIDKYKKEEEKDKRHFKERIEELADGEPFEMLDDDTAVIDGITFVRHGFHMGMKINCSVCGNPVKNNFDHISNIGKVLSVGAQCAKCYEETVWDQD